MKALTLTQPWATLVALGLKQIETRSWTTNHQGALAIHAAKGFPTSAKRLACEPGPIRDALLRAFPGLDCAGVVAALPRGKVIATARLAGCAETDPDLWEPGRYRYGSVLLEWPIPEPERSFGDYAPGRWMWLLHAVEPLAVPIPARGALGLWNWTPPLLVN